MSNLRAGDSNRITREYMDALLIQMKNLGGRPSDTRQTFFGRRFATPLTTAALSHLKSERGDGMVELAKAARDANALMFCGMGSLQELEAVCATGAQVVKIIKPYDDDREIYRRIERAQELNCLAVGMDIDHSFDKAGNYDVVRGEKMQAVDAEKLRRFMQHSPLPFVVKGVLSLHDARICLDLGVQGIVVSHHHGIMDFAPPPARMLPAIRDLVGDRMTIFLDCGMANGADAFKALALGADGVSLGRVLMPALEQEGAAGAAREIARINGELRQFMAHTATHDMNSFDFDSIITP